VSGDSLYGLAPTANQYWRLNINILQVTKSYDTCLVNTFVYRSYRAVVLILQLQQLLQHCYRCDRTNRTTDRRYLALSERCFILHFASLPHSAHLDYCVHRCDHKTAAAATTTTTTTTAATTTSAAAIAEMTTIIVVIIVILNVYLSASLAQCLGSGFGF